MVQRPTIDQNCRSSEECAGTLDPLAYLRTQGVIELTGRPSVLASVSPMPLKELLGRVWISQIWPDASSDRCPDNRGSCVRSRRSMVP